VMGSLQASSGWRRIELKHSVRRVERMSMIGNYLKLSDEQLDSLVNDPSKAKDLVYAKEEDDPSDLLDIDKSWHLIHFLLTGDGSEGDYPLVNAVLGGKELPETDAGYGPYRYLVPDEVEAVSQALASISAEDLWSRFNASRVKSEDIYPSIWTGDEDDKAYISQNYEALRRYFADAAASGDAMLLYLS
jgi:hypothetical protein